MEVLLVWLEGSALGQLMRSSGVWTYGLVNLVHILGVATLFGAVLVLDLRLLGAWRRVPLAHLERPTVPLALGGFALAAASGACMISTNATEYYGNPFLLLKFGAIGLGVLNLAVAQFVPAWRRRGEATPVPRARLHLAAIGAASLVCWVGAVAMGRMIGYW